MVADAAGGDADVDGLLLGALPVVSGAVDARVGAGLFGVDIGRVLSIVIVYNAYACASANVIVYRCPCRALSSALGPVHSIPSFVHTHRTGVPLYCVADASI